MLLAGLPLSGLVLIRDSWRCDGTSVLLSLLQSLPSPATFIATAHNPAHYEAIFKKAASKLRFIQADSPWAEEVGSDLLEPPLTWSEDAERVTLHPQHLLSALESDTHKTLILDDLSGLFYSLNGNLAACVRFINALRGKFETVIVKAPSELPVEFLENGCSVVIEIAPLESGYSRAITGQIRVRKRENWTLLVQCTEFVRVTESGLQSARLY